MSYRLSVIDFRVGRSLLDDHSESVTKSKLEMDTSPEGICLAGVYASTKHSTFAIDKVM